MSKEALKQKIDETIYENLEGDISGENLNEILNDIVDEIPEGSGTDVEANPEGEATETMTKLRIGDTIYTAPQGPQGETGPQGPQGPQGETGETGPQGPAGTNAVNPFKGLFSSYANLTSAFQAPSVGDYAYVINQSPAGTASVYVCNTAGTWTDSQDDVDLSSVNINGGLTQTAKNLILSLFRKAAYTTNDAEEDIDDLEEEFEDTRTLLRIEATFNQGANVIYDDASLDSLKPYLTVEAYYDNGTHETVDNDYVLLIGNLTAGTSTITASYEGETDDFTVIVTAAPVVVSIAANYTGGDVVVDSNIDNLKADLTVTATLDNNTTRPLNSDEYDLDGDLTEAGTAQITVTYLADNNVPPATFNVTVVAQAADFTFVDSNFTKYHTSSNQYLVQQSTVPYCVPSQTRHIYAQFDKSTGGGTFKVKVGSNYTTAGVAFTFYTQSAQTKITNHTALQMATVGNPTVDGYEVGWLTLDSNHEAEFVVPEYAINGDTSSLITCFRIVVRQADNNPNINGDFVINSVEVYKLN